jgi:Cu(I)/Ag(I) efflux system membrane fusion protein
MLTGRGELAEKATGAPAGSTPSANEVEKHEHQGRDPAVATYTCSMHPAVKASEPGTCPSCGMALTGRAKAPEDLP